MVSSQGVGHRLWGYDGQCLGVCNDGVCLALPAHWQDVVPANDEEDRRRVAVPKDHCVQARLQRLWLYQKLHGFTEKMKEWDVKAQKMEKM
jgi:hypothetical protein